MAFDRSATYQAADAVSAVYAELGRAYAEPGDSGSPRVLDAERRSVLEAWVRTLIPGDGVWPSAAAVDAVGHIDRTVALAARSRPIVLAALDTAAAEAERRFGIEFGSLSQPQLVELLEWCEVADPLQFTLLKELTYEAYYRDPDVARLIESRTGFRARVPVDGLVLDADDDRAVYALMQEVAARPSLVREVPT
jgi:hypothetical protein